MVVRIDEYSRGCQDCRPSKEYFVRYSLSCSLDLLCLYCCLPGNRYQQDPRKHPYRRETRSETTRSGALLSQSDSRSRPAPAPLRSRQNSSLSQSSLPAKPNVSTTPLPRLFPSVDSNFGPIPSATNQPSKRFSPYVRSPYTSAQTKTGSASTSRSRIDETIQLETLSFTIDPPSSTRVATPARLVATSSSNTNTPRSGSAKRGNPSTKKQLQTSQKKLSYVRKVETIVISSSSEEEVEERQTRAQKSAEKKARKKERREARKEKEAQAEAAKLEAEAEIEAEVEALAEEVVELEVEVQVDVEVEVELEQVVEVEVEANPTSVEAAGKGEKVDEFLAPRRGDVLFSWEKEQAEAEEATLEEADSDEYEWDAGTTDHEDDMTLTIPISHTNVPIVDDAETSPIVDAEAEADMPEEAIPEEAIPEEAIPVELLEERDDSIEILSDMDVYQTSDAEEEGETGGVILFGTTEDAQPDTAVQLALTVAVVCTNESAIVL